VTQHVDIDPQSATGTNGAPTVPATDRPDFAPTGSSVTSGPAHAAAAELPAMGVGAVAQIGARIGAAMGQVILGKPEVIRLALVCLLTEGHLLIEDVPGTGKTSLAKALAKSQDGTVSRVQFTPDLMPSDVTGVSIYDRQSSQFEFRPGPVFANVVVADEINRASPKTQSALLEAMEERQVTVDGTSYRLPRPFLVLATQNPVEMEGTYPLPEAQRDRFLARTAIGYPNPDAEIAMLAGHDRVDPLDQLTAVADTPTVAGMIQATTGVQVSPALRAYLVELVSATRALPEIRLGASPRAVLHLGRAAKAAAALDGRDFVVPDDIQRLAIPVLAHRLLLTVEAHAAHRSAEDIIAGLIGRVRVPRAASA
jgi:MoxR-like ATPase